MKVKSVNVFFQRVLIVIFFIIIFVPCLRMILADKTFFSYTEKRTLATFPRIPDSFSQIQLFFSEVDEYLKDHFGFREWMVYRYQREVRKRFGDSENNTKVLRGESNWYFYTGDRLLKDYTGKNLLNDKDLENWVLAYNEKQKWLEEKGIRYLLVVPPDKQSIYGELLGEPWVSNKGMTRFTQIKNRLSDDESFVLVDLGPILLENKSGEMLYWKSDTHWTPYGAYLAYQVIAKKIESLFPGTHFKQDFTFTQAITRKCESGKDRCGDLTNMLLDFDSFDETYRNIARFSPCAIRSSGDLPLSDINTEDKDYYFSTRCRTGQLKALVFKDSFFIALTPYFSENFQKVIYLSKEYDQKIIEEILSTFKPDIVIEEKLERSL